MDSSGHIGWRRTTTRLLCLTLALGSASCAESIDANTDVSIAPESRAGHVVFVIESLSTFYGLSVFPCGSDRSLWTIGRGGGTSLPPSHIVYGQAPTDFQEQAPAQPLPPGCYRVVVSGLHETQFTINPDGTVSADTASRTPPRGRQAPPGSR
jgi:hypothetical protein